MLGRREQVLVLAALAGQRASDGRFSVKDLRALYMSFRVPEPAHPYAILTALENSGALVRFENLRAVTPLGQKRVRTLLEDPEWEHLGALGLPYGGSLFGNAVHAVVPPELCPSAWLAPIQTLLETYPFETNVFLMTRFPAATGHEEIEDAVAAAVPAVRECIAAYGLTLHLTSDRQLADDLLGNVAAHMWACRYGIGIFEDRLRKGLNYNVIAEVGAMLMTGRRCALLKDTTAPSLPSDISGQIYKPVDLSNTADVVHVVSGWVEADLGLAH